LIHWIIVLVVVARPRFLQDQPTEDDLDDHDDDDDQENAASCAACGRLQFHWAHLPSEFAR
jgi:hypothetical protein